MCHKIIKSLSFTTNKKMMTKQNSYFEKSTFFKLRHDALCFTVNIKRIGHAIFKIMNLYFLEILPQTLCLNRVSNSHLLLILLC